jgi:uncharacterized membrane protein
MAVSSIFLLLFGTKVIRCASSYVAHVVSKNFMSQIYLDKVLSRGEAPPKLFNQYLISMAIEFVVFVVFMALLYSADRVIDMFPKLPPSIFTEYLLVDFVMYMFMISAIGWIVSSTMYKKKYFLYKDDGLRAIRALSEILIYISILLTIVPFNYLANGIVQEFKS